jgi:DNA invertase Pin-like site-specific DNA recombinase
VRRCDGWPADPALSKFYSTPIGTKALRQLEAGDVLIVTRLDRLARSTRDSFDILDAVGRLEHRSSR